MIPTLILSLLQYVFTGVEKVFPTGAAGVTITGGAAAYEKGAYATVMAKASSPATNGWVACKLNIEALSVAEIYEFDVAYGDVGSEVIFATVRAGTVRYIQIPGPLFNGQYRISVRCNSASGGADTAVVSISYNTTPIAL